MNRMEQLCTVYLAALDLLPQVGEMYCPGPGADGKVNPCPQAALSATTRDEIRPWMEKEFRALLAACEAIAGPLPCGEKFRSENPDWPHECCFAEDCYHRLARDGRNICECPNECDYYCGVKP